MTIAANKFAGLFPPSCIGMSSTYRELTGLMLGMLVPEVQELVRGKVTRVNLDSAAGVQNLLNGGGSVSDLCGLVRKLWQIWHDLGVTPFPKWCRRTERNMRVVDALSKSVSFQLTDPSGLEELCDLPVTLPDFNSIGLCVNTILAGRRSMAIVVPRWEGKPWWTTVTSNATRLYCFPSNSVRARSMFSLRTVVPWEFVLVVFAFN